MHHPPRLSATASVVAATMLFVACSSSSSSSPTLGDADLEALTSSFAGVASSAGKSGSGGATAQSVAPAGIRVLAGDVRTLSWCSPTSLTPPVECAGGGNIYTTLNMQCSEPSGCCGANPACASDSMHFGGQGTLTHNSCRMKSDSGSSIVINGALSNALTANFTIACTGSSSGKLVYTISGNLSVTVDGHEVCNGMTLLTVTATVDQTVTVNVNGTICGEHVFRTYNEGCVVTCGNGSCCGGGTTCSACSDSCIPVGGVDCCNGKHCPAGTRCVSNGTQCAL